MASLQGVKDQREMGILGPMLTQEIGPEIDTKLKLATSWNLTANFVSCAEFWKHKNLLNFLADFLNVLYRMRQTA